MVGANLSLTMAQGKIDQSAENLKTSLESVPLPPAVLPGTIRPPSRFPPLTPEQSDEVARTIYVGNVNSEVTNLSQNRIVDLLTIHLKGITRSFTRFF